MKPQPKLDGLPICPFVKQYIENIAVIETDNWEKKISQVCELLSAVGYEAVVICGPMEDWDELMTICDDYQARYWHKDVEILVMHPDTDDFPLPIYYLFNQNLRKELVNFLVLSFYQEHFQFKLDVLML